MGAEHPKRQFVIVIVIVIVIIAPNGVKPLTGALPRGRLRDGKHLQLTHTNSRKKPTRAMFSSGTDGRARTGDGEIKSNGCRMGRLVLHMGGGWCVAGMQGVRAPEPIDRGQTALTSCPRM